MSAAESAGLERCLKLQDELDKLLVARVLNGSLKDVAKWVPESKDEMLAWDRLTDPENLDALNGIVRALPDDLLSASVALWKYALIDCHCREAISHSQAASSAYDRIRHRLLLSGNRVPLTAKLRNDLDTLLRCYYGEMRSKELADLQVEVSPFMAVLIQVSAASQERQPMPAPKAATV